MIKALRCTMLLLVFSLGSTMLYACSFDAGNPNKEAGIKQIVESFIEAYNSGDADAAIAFLSADITVADKASPEVTVQDARFIEASLKSNAEFNRHWEILNYLAEAENSITLEVRSTGEDIELAGLDSVVSEITFKVSDGKISKMITSTNAEQLAQMANNTAGGIGIATDLKSDRIIITSILPDSPAQAAGLKVGFEIMAIDGLKCSEMKQGEQLLRIRGIVGTKIVLTVNVPNTNETYDVELTRVDMSTLPKI